MLISVANGNLNILTLFRMGGGGGGEGGGGILMPAPTLNSSQFPGILTALKFLEFLLFFQSP